MSRDQIPSNRPVWLAIIFIMAVLVAAGAGFLLHLAKASPAGTLTAAGAAFVAAMTLGMAASRFLASCRSTVMTRTTGRRHTSWPETRA